MTNKHDYKIIVNMDVVEFIEEYIGIELLSYQKIILRSIDKVYKNKLYRHLFPRCYKK